MPTNVTALDQLSACLTHALSRDLCLKDFYNSVSLSPAQASWALLFLPTGSNLLCSLLWCWNFLWWFHFCVDSFVGLISIGNPRVDSFVVPHGLIRAQLCPRWFSRLENRISGAPGNVNCIILEACNANLLQACVISIFICQSQGVSCNLAYIKISLNV